MALARALITDPEALLLDEPLSALDPFLKIRMRAELKKLQTSLGITFVHVTHSQEEAMALADLIVVMNDGAHRAGRAAAHRVRTAGDGLRRPLHGRPQRHFRPCHRPRTTAWSRSTSPAAARSRPRGEAGEAGAPIDIGIRTDHVRIGEPAAKGLGFTGIVSNIEYRGATVKLSVDRRRHRGLHRDRRRRGLLRHARRRSATRCRSPGMPEDAVVLGRLDS